MIRECMYCHSMMGLTDDHVTGDERVTSGICVPCLDLHHPYLSDQIGARPDTDIWGDVCCLIIVLIVALMGLYAIGCLAGVIK